MSYYTYTKQELARAGIQEGEVAIYTGTRDPKEFENRFTGATASNAYVYLWKDGDAQGLSGAFRADQAGVDVLEVLAAEERYRFLRDKKTGYLRQIAGPAKPVTVGNLGAIPLRVDTFLGKFTVHTGSILRLDENAPRREKKKVLLTFSNEAEHMLDLAEIWDGSGSRRLNIVEDRNLDWETRLTVQDGAAVVQCMTVSSDMGSSDKEIHILRSPEPEPDYEIYIMTAEFAYPTLRFDTTDYKDGMVVLRKRILPFARSRRIYSLNQVESSPTNEMAGEYAVEWAEWEAGAPDLRESPALLPVPGEDAFDRDAASGDLCAEPLEALRWRTPQARPPEGPDFPSSAFAQTESKLERSQECGAAPTGLRPEAPEDFPK